MASIPAGGGDGALPGRGAGAALANAPGADDAPVHDLLGGVAGGGVIDIDSGHCVALKKKARLSQPTLVGQCLPICHHFHLVCKLL